MSRAGRFFVTNELKIAFCFLLLNYDWEFVPGTGLQELLEIEGHQNVNPESKLRFRRRHAEVDLRALSATKG